MEWVQTTAKTLDEAKDRALDQLGVAADEAEFDVLEEPRTGLFGRLRGEARVRARVKPAAVRPKQERRGRNRRDDRGRGKKGGKPSGRGKNDGGKGGGAKGGGTSERDAGDDGKGGGGKDDGGNGGQRGAGRGERRDAAQQRDGSQRRSQPVAEQAATSEATAASNGDGSRRRGQRSQQKEKQAMDNESTVTPQEVGDAAVAFMSGLAEAFGADATTDVTVDGTDLEVRTVGTELGLMVGPGGRTLLAIQDLARVASQRRLGDHDTRLRVDVGGYREKRRAALEKFALAVANEVVAAGQPKALEPMTSADRKIIHDSLADVEGVTSRSEGDDPTRRVIISPA
ncbi:MAG: RNA-binding cell elongation regulator Jag/EloR [Ilumatobacter sp.]|uniref:RNA-binding cell elongation regulator Jag/EloR n=1 Tax=Ilumatobacter sp. TaxID=1967498 RepID=UPI002639266E|nr:RNA-binding cell elongation regulator Jag/EloR [Ilumatobacter sp.]MDJ0771619.1 RNA-binding cell elongation regulator Jag/EloR [Ilumatobacter sp.]